MLTRYNNTQRIEERSLIKDTLVYYSNIVE
ncbi:MAG: hypothetical protein ACI8RD_007470 [Bacillariaceae sp.]